jgi:hypothetical protein
MPGKPFTKGDSRINRKGRPKVGESLAEKFRDALAERLQGDYSKLDSLIDKTVDMALKGNQQAIEFVLARGWGKMIDRVEITPKQEFDLSKLSDEEIERLEEIQRKLEQKDLLDAGDR